MSHDEVGLHSTRNRLGQKALLKGMCADQLGVMAGFDVGIIGAGPAGLAAGIRLRALGVPRVAIVDRQDFPRDKTCGSAISPKGIEVLKTLGVYEAVAAKAQWINGMRLVTPAGHDVRMIGQSDAALICNRRIFDEILLRHAEAAGVVFHPDVQIDHLLTRDDRVVGFQSKNGLQLKADFTMVADGAKSRFALDRGARRMLQTIMGWWDDFEHRPNEIEMIFDPLVAPLYGWLFPETETRVNIGICYEDLGLDKKGRDLFQTFLDKHYKDRISRAQQSGAWKGHPISYSVDIGRLTSPGRFVIGEAGRITHPATGEGIYQAMTSGLKAAEAIASVLNGKSTEAAAGASYEVACRKAFSMSFKIGMGWRRAVSAGMLDVIAKAAKLPVVQKRLASTMAHM